MQRGFTLFEIVITLAVIGIVIAVAGKFNGDTSYFGGIFQKGLNQADESRRILRPLANEVRSASPSATGAYLLEDASINSFIFFSDIDNNGSIERVRYFLSGTTLKKGVIKPTGTPAGYTGTETITDVVHNIVNGATPIFTYFDAAYDGTTEALTQPVTISVIRLVKVTLIVDADPNRPPSSMTVSTQVALRNVKDNL